jgi:hypothetical protein
MSAHFKNRVSAFAVLVTVFVACPRLAQAGVMTFPGLTAIRFTEVSGVALPHFYLPASPQMTNQLGVLNVVNNDFTGAPTEVYDVFYSDANGALNVNGNYVTIEARFAGQAGGGLNIAAVDLLLGPAPFMICRADILASFVGLGSNYVAGSELLAVDPDGVIPSTFSVMGNTAGVPGRMRVTVGWTKIQVPEPSGVALSLMGSMLTVGYALRRRRINASHP